MSEVTPVFIMRELKVGDVVEVDWDTLNVSARTNVLPNGTYTVKNIRKCETQYLHIKHLTCCRECKGRILFYNDKGIEHGCYGITVPPYFPFVKRTDPCVSLLDSFIDTLGEH